jgi:hypothetical protein
LAIPDFGSGVDYALEDPQGGHGALRWRLSSHDPRVRAGLFAEHYGGERWGCAWVDELCWGIEWRELGDQYVDGE